jgi:hypothetical protein
VDTISGRESGIGVLVILVWEYFKQQRVPLHKQQSWRRINNRKYIYSNKNPFG